MEDSNMKVAILISGDYRAFDVCMPTMHPFLQNNDIYVSTWTESHQAHPHDAGLCNHITDINDVKIRKLLKDYNVVGTKVDYFKKDYWYAGITKYNSPMCNRWDAGVSLIRDSNINYTHLVVLRPDLYFHPHTYINWQDIRPNTLYSAWYHPTSVKFNEVVFIGEIDAVIKCLITEDQWRAAPAMADWHTFLYQHIASTGVLTAYFCGHCPVLMARPPMDNITCYEDVQSRFNHWRDLYIEHQRLNYGMKGIRQIWGDEFVNKLYPDRINEDT
jgi:hypothetical protein